MTFFSALLASAAVALFGVSVLGQVAPRTIATEISIDAPADAVWDRLVAQEGIADWNPFMTRLEGDISVGSQLAVTIRQPNGTTMDFTPEVLVADEARELRWVGRLGFKGVFDGEHSFVLETQPDGSTLLRHGETFRGALVHVLFPLIGAGTLEGFEAMNVALRETVEADV